MTGITDLPTLLSKLSPSLADEEYVFLNRNSSNLGAWEVLTPFAVIVEEEGLTWIVPREQAEAEGEAYDGLFRRITLQIHSSLTAVGLTATVAQALYQCDISVNIVAAFYHDHLLVPAARAEEALRVIEALSQQRIVD